MVDAQKKPFVIAGTGCCLLDYIYAGVNFGAPEFKSYCSRRQGDGGLVPGKLAFTEDFELFAGRDLAAVLDEITAGRSVDAINIGGPSIVALIHAAQVLDPARFEIRFAGPVGADDVGSELRRQLALTPLASARLITKPGRTPRTIVLSDPGFDQGRGERTFLNTLGAAGEFSGDDLADDFYAADLVVLGGTGLVPRLHDALDSLLAKAKRANAFTVVNTVYDFRHQRQDPNARWPLGSSDESYGRIDLLIADLEEALRLSGTETLDASLDFFMAHGVGAVVVTNGARDVAVRMGSSRYAQGIESRYPISRAIADELAAYPKRKGDTTGCGDNFVGGMLASVACQLESGAPEINLGKAIAWGVVSGGLACFQMGGVLFESHPGQKKALMDAYLETYRVAT